MEKKPDTTQTTVRVLIADDSEEDRALFRHILKSVDDFEVIGTTVNGADTIAYLNGLSPYENRRIHPEPDLIFLDFQMPRLSGLDVLRHLRSSSRDRKIVLWSDVPDLINEPSAYHLGASLVCAKPHLRSDLLSILARAFTAPRPSRAARAHAAAAAGKSEFTPESQPKSF